MAHLDAQLASWIEIEIGRLDGERVDSDTFRDFRTLLHNVWGELGHILVWCVHHNTTLNASNEDRLDHSYKRKVKSTTAPTIVGVRLPTTMSHVGNTRSIQHRRRLFLGGGSWKPGKIPGSSLAESKDGASM